VVSDELQRQLAQAEQHVRSGRRRQGRRAFERLVARYPESSESHFQLALLLLDDGDFEGAVGQFREVLRIRPDIAEVHFNLGTLLTDLGRPADAVSSLKRALELRPEFAEAHNNLGIIYQKQGESEFAIGCFQEAVRHAPSHSAATLNLASAMVRMKRSEGVLEICQRACELNPGIAQAQMLLGCSWELLGREDEAFRCFEEGAKLDPTSPSAYFLAARGGNAVPRIAPAEYVKELFDAYAARFDEHLTGRLNYRTPEQIHRAVLKIVSGDRLRTLDLGCGTGLAGRLIRDSSEYLVGVDLSPAMIQEAVRAEIYDETFVQDITGYLQADTSEFDLILAADVFVYIGDLSETFQGVWARLRPGGVFAFSVEAAEASTDPQDAEEGYQLSCSRRYQHRLSYLRNLADETGFQVPVADKAVLRTQGREEVEGWVVVFKKPSSVAEGEA